MALFSDIDWTILLAVAGFLVLGKDGGQMVRQAGKLYGRFTRLKSELLAEFTKAAEIPAPVPGAPTSIRQSLLNWEPTPGRTIGIPAAVTVAPLAAAPLTPAPADALGPSTWADTAPGGTTWSRSEP